LAPRPAFFLEGDRKEAIAFTGRSVGLLLAREIQD